MSRNVFAHAFERDICLTALEEPALGARVLARGHGLADARWAELIAGGRAALQEGVLKAKAALRLAGVLTDAGFADEAVCVLSDARVDYAGREPLRRARLAFARLAMGQARDAVAELDAARRAGLEESADGVPAIAWAVGQAPSPGLDHAIRWTELLCRSGLADAAARALAPLLARAGPGAPDGLIEAAFGALRMAAPAPARDLLEAMAAIYAAEGRAGAHAEVLAVLDGGADGDAEPEAPEAGPRKLLLRACLAEACAASGMWPAAIRRFDFAGKRSGEPDDSLCELARCVGRDLLETLDISLLPAGGPRRTLDLFPFNGEFAMLQLKLREMVGWADRFVLVEADQTFTGLPKRLYFRDEPGAGGAFADRIAHLVVGPPPGHIASTWAREFFQKDSTARGLSGACAPDDLVLLSDVDEIIDRAALEGFDGDLAPLELRTFKFFINCELVADQPHLKTAVARARFVAAHGWDYLRLAAIRHRKALQLPKAGWHFTSIGDPQWLARKMQCTAHEEWSYQDRAFFEKRLRRLRQGGVWPGLVRREIDDSFPRAIRESRELLADFIL